MHTMDYDMITLRLYILCISRLALKRFSLILRNVVVVVENTV